VVRPLARMRGRGEREGARVVCSERRKERKGECGVVAGHFNRHGGGEKEKGGLVWDVPRGGRSWGTARGTGAVIGRCGVAGTGLEPVCTSGWEACPSAQQGWWGGYQRGPDHSPGRRWLNLI
jgi:hypothetical protein